MMKSKIICHESQNVREKYYEIDHRSGLKILVCPKNFSTFFAIFGTKFGSADNTYIVNDKKIVLPDGSAHFLEHKLFENADGSSADEHFTALGADANAYTTYTATRYLFSATKKFDECLSHLLYFVTHPHFTEENVQKERGIIEQEIMMYADDPYETVMEECLRSMYHYSGVSKSICGSAESISRITPELLNTVYRHFYNLSNMILSVCGNITPEEVIDIADRELPCTASNFCVTKFCEPEPQSVRKPYTEKRMSVASPLFFIGVKDIPACADGYEKIKKSLAMTILNNMLFSGSGEFYNKLLTDGLITPGFSFGYSSGDACSMNYFSGNSDDPKRVLELIRQKCREAAAGKLSVSDFNRCKRSSIAAFVKSFDSTSEIADDVMLSMYSSGVDPFMIPEMTEKLTFEDVYALAKNLFEMDDNWTLSVILPL